MANLKETAKQFGGKKELTDLPEIPVDIEVRKDSYQKDGQTREYYYIELNGWKYTIRAEALEKIKTVITLRPQTTKIKFYKDDKGQLAVMPLD
jgi:hypothetical protein